MEYVIALSNPNRPHRSNHFGSVIAQFSSTTLLLTLFIVARFVKSVMTYCLQYSLNPLHPTQLITTNTS